MAATKMFDGMFGQIEPGMCRLSMNGEIAVHTNNGYKTYNMKTGRLTNCSNFVFDIGEEFFFVIPTTKAKVGDILLVSGKPKCVIKVEKNLLTVINYEDSTVENVLPERHVFMGSTYFYGKIVSLFSGFGKGKSGANKMMQYMLLTQMFKGTGTRIDNNSNMQNLLPLMLMSGNNMSDMFDGMFDFAEDDDEDEDDGSFDVDVDIDITDDESEEDN